MKKLFLLLVCPVFYLLFSCKAKTDKKEITVEKKDSVIKLTLTTKQPAAMNDEGVNTDYYENGKEKMKGTIKDGKREGLWQAWYENGNLWSEAEYSKGINDGKSVTYFESGKVRYEGLYKEGKKIRDWKYYDEDGKLVKTVKN
ncbi:MAG: hypothetical protein IPP32_05975 [Bacteroidetes bacterium]|nr:hypothetical protein [Bacteroidota bacterium]